MYLGAMIAGKRLKKAGLCGDDSGVTLSLNAG
jgi:hypothetical protein